MLKNLELISHLPVLHLIIVIVNIRLIFRANNKKSSKIKHYDLDIYINPRHIYY